MAKLYFRYGAMNSGKSTALMQVAHNYEERGMRVLVLKPRIDSASDDVFALLQREMSTETPPACILCDESQFFTAVQAEQLFRATCLLNVPVICYGLRTDFSMRGFPGSTRLLELAHTVEEMKTICFCGRKALCNGRKINGEFVFEGDQVAIDQVGDVEYVSLCPQCYFREREKFYAKIHK